MKNVRLLLASAILAVAVASPMAAMTQDDGESPDDPVGPVNPNPDQGLKKYEYNPLTETGKCWNYSCGFGWCCWVY
jgi:hypothetical protein